MQGNSNNDSPTRGIMRYSLSDRTFIDKGWTLLPVEKVIRKVNIYRMHPAQPEFDWFAHNKSKGAMQYETGEKLAEFDDNGRGRWYYRNGRLALDYYDSKEINSQQRIVIYSSGDLDHRGRSYPITILATFDYLGNGIVFDHGGKIRLKYNQSEGVVLDREIGPVSHWQWHSLNDPPVLQRVMIDTHATHKDPEILKLGPPDDFKKRVENEDMLAIEYDNFIKDKNKKQNVSYSPFQVKMKALKINDQFSLKILDQATIYLIFRDKLTHMKLNLGMILDNQEIVDTSSTEMGEISNSLEKFPAKSESIEEMQLKIANAKRFDHVRKERERHLKQVPAPTLSVDRMAAATSRPLRKPLRAVPSGSSATQSSKRRKPPSLNLYYDTRIV